MHATDPATAAARLERLAGFLHQDPDNASLLADACDAALESGSHLQAETFLASARRLQLQAPEWQHRRAHLCLARGELDEARTLLEALQARNGWHPALVHDLAVALQQVHIGQIVDERTPCSSPGPMGPRRTCSAPSPAATGGASR